MFSSRDIDPLMREKEHTSRSQPLRGYCHRRTPLSRTQSSDSYTARSPAGMWERSFSSHDPYHKPRFGGDFPQPWQSMSPNGQDFDRPTTTTPRSGAYHNERRITFAQAITNMISALNYANEGLQKLEKSFSHDIAALRLWLPSQHVDSLWVIYTAWNGIPANSTAKHHHPTNLKADTGETSNRSAPPTAYAEITTRISKALAGLKHCSPPPDELALGGDDGLGYLAPNPQPDYFYTNSGTTGLGWHVLRTTMRKLEISFEAIEELTGLVRTHRDRMPALRHEIGAALQLLEGMKPLMEQVPPEKSKGRETGTGTGTGRRNGYVEEKEEYEYEWPDCGSI